MAKTEYRYNGYDGAYFIIQKRTGYWGLKVNVPGKVVLLVYNYFPTKRAAKKVGMNALWNYTIKKDGAAK